MTNKERFKEIFISQVTRPGAADLLAWLGTTDFFEAPASTRFHGAYPGGLVEHSLNVYYALLGQSTIREYGGESVAVVALLHDVCKTGYYRRERDGKYSVKDQLPMGHGEKSVYLVMKFMDLTDEEALAIRWHMGAYDDAFRGREPGAERSTGQMRPCAGHAPRRYAGGTGRKTAGGHFVMAFRLELSDLPPRYRAQAEAQLAKGRKKRSDPLAEAARAAKITGKEFDSLGEYEYYIGTVAPKVARGEIVEWEAHPCFPLFPAGQYGALKLRPVRYTADFRLVYADGTVEIVEIKSKFVRRMQRDYALRRRVFLEQVARPAGWKFTEIITADSKEEIDRWTELTKGAK